MERLSLIMPPENMESYNTKSYCTRKRSYLSRSEDSWVRYFASGEAVIRWVVPWWRIQRMMTSDDEEGLTISGLRALTFYFPVRLMRQYGRKQVIPDRDTRRPPNHSIVKRSLKRWVDFWVARPKLEVLDLEERDANTSRFYKKWMTATNATARADHRAAERNELKKKRPLDDKDAFVPNPKRSERTTANSVKDRLGPRTAPVWSRLGPLNEEKSRKSKTKAQEKTMPKKRKLKKTYAKEASTSGVEKEANEMDKEANASGMDKEKKD